MRCCKWTSLSADGATWFTAHHAVVVIGGSGGGVPGCPPIGSMSFIFLQFSAKIVSTNRFSYQTRGWCPPPRLRYPGSATGCGFTLTFTLSKLGGFRVARAPSVHLMPNNTLAPTPWEILDLPMLISIHSSCSFCKTIKLSHTNTQDRTGQHT